MRLNLIFFIILDQLGPVLTDIHVLHLPGSDDQFSMHLRYSCIRDGHAITRISSNGIFTNIERHPLCLGRPFDVGEDNIARYLRITHDSILIIQINNLLTNSNIIAAHPFSSIKTITKRKDLPLG